MKKGEFFPVSGSNSDAENAYDLGDEVLANSRAGGVMATYTPADMEFLKKIEADFPEFRFKFGKKFAFRPPKTIMIGPHEADFRLLFLHELGHAILKHRDFKTDVMRLKMEVAAWEKARELAKRYGVEFSEEVAEAELDSYRDWLHKKSRCPSCGLTRFATPDGKYHCPRCENLKV